MKMTARKKRGLSLTKDIDNYLKKSIIDTLNHESPQMQKKASQDINHESAQIQKKVQSQNKKNLTDQIQRLNDQISERAIKKISYLQQLAQQLKKKRQSNNNYLEMGIYPTPIAYKDYITPKRLQFSANYRTINNTQTIPTNFHRSNYITQYATPIKLLKCNSPRNMSSYVLSSPNKQNRQPIQRHIYSSINESYPSRSVIPVSFHQNSRPISKSIVKFQQQISRVQSPNSQKKANKTVRFSQPKISEEKVEEKLKRYNKDQALRQSILLKSTSRQKSKDKLGKNKQNGNKKQYVGRNNRLYSEKSNKPKKNKTKKY